MTQQPARRKPSFILISGGVIAALLVVLGGVSWWNSGSLERNRSAFKEACQAATQARLNGVAFTGDYEPTGDVNAWQWVGTAGASKVLCVQRSGQPAPELIIK